MFARSTAARQREGLSSPNATSTSQTWVPRASRFDGLMSRCAAPVAQSLRTWVSASSMTGSPTPDSSISTASGTSSVTTRYSRPADTPTSPCGSGTRTPPSLSSRRMQSSRSARRRTRKRRLVLQPSVQQDSREHHPAVRTHVSRCVDLVEQRGRRRRQDQAARCRAGGPLQPVGLEVDEFDSQLVANGIVDPLFARRVQPQVGLDFTPECHRECAFRRQQTECERPLVPSGALAALAPMRPETRSTSWRRRLFRAPRYSPTTPPRGATTTTGRR